MSLIQIAIDQENDAATTRYVDKIIKERSIQMIETKPVQVRGVPVDDWDKLKDVANEQGMDRAQMLRAIFSKLASGELKVDMTWSVMEKAQSATDAMADAETSASLGIPNGFTSN